MADVELQTRDQGRLEPPSRLCARGVPVAAIELGPRQLEQLLSPPKVPEHAEELRHELVAETALVGAAKGGPQMVHGARGIGPERLRSAQLEQHSGALARRRRLGERALEERRRGLGRAVLERRPRGAVKLVHDPLVTRGRRLQEVRAHDLARGALAREQARRARVEEGPRAGRLVLEDGRSHHRMDEPEWRRRGQDAQLHKRIGELGGLREVQLRELGRVPQLAVLPHQRGGLNQPAGAGSHPADSRQARVRDVPRAERLQERRRGRRRGHALGPEGRAKLPKQERVALSGAMACREELRIPLAQPLAHHSRGRFQG